MSAAEDAARVEEARFRVEAGHGTREDRRLLDQDRRGRLAVDAGIDAYGVRVLPLQGGVS